MRHSLITALDHVAHFLYCPTMLGRRSARARWHHRLHLIPGRWLAAACDTYDRSLGVTEEEMYSTGRVSAALHDLAEADLTEDEFDTYMETAEDIAAIFDAGEKGLTAPPVYALACPDGCTRLESSAPFVGGKATGACGQEMRPAPVSSTSGYLREAP